MTTVTQLAAEAIASRLQAWKKELKVELSAEGDSVVATAKSIDLTYDDLRELAEIVGPEGATITFGRSGPNFRMIIW